MVMAKMNGVSLDDIAKINGVTVIGLGDAVVAEVVSGKTFYAGSTTLLTGEQTLATAELFKHARAGTDSVAQVYINCTLSGGEVPANAIRVLCAVVAQNTAVNGDERIIYNGVEKVTQETSWLGGYHCVWEGAGLDSAADLYPQVKVDAGTETVNAGFVGWYQALG